MTRSLWALQTDVPKAPGLQNSTFIAHIVVLYINRMNFWSSLLYFTVFRCTVFISGLENVIHCDLWNLQTLMVSNLKILWLSSSAQHENCSLFFFFLTFRLIQQKYTNTGVHSVYILFNITEKHHHKLLSPSAVEHGATVGLRPHSSSVLTRPPAICSPAFSPQNRLDQS